MERRLLIGLCADVPGHHAVPAAAEEVWAAASGESRRVRSRAAHAESAAVGSNAASSDATTPLSRGQDEAAANARQASAPSRPASESETVIENDVYRIVFTNRGARVKSWMLKKYTDDKGGPLELVNTGGVGEVRVSADAVVI